MGGRAAREVAGTGGGGRFRLTLLQGELCSSREPWLREQPLTLRLGAEAEWYWSAQAKSLTEVKLPQ